MYTIEYYKTKKKKPIVKEPKYTNNNEEINYMIRKRYLHQKDLIDKCWNIKSLTIDITDISNIIYDKSMHKLFSLYAKTQRLNKDNTDNITILNNNIANLSYIYAIINCKWMINKDEPSNIEETTSEMIKSMNNLIIQYENTTTKLEKNKLKRQIQSKKHLLEYYMNSTNDKNSLTRKKIKKGGYYGI